MSVVNDLFVITIARASRRARRHLNDLSSADRDDVLGSAILWCWENRTEYNPSVPLEDWFVGAIRNAKLAWRRGERRNSASVVDDIGAPDDTQGRANTLEAAERMAGALDETSIEVAKMLAHGHGHREIRRKLGVDANTVSKIVRDIRQLRHLLPEAEYQRALRGSRSDSDNDTRPLASIDREIERLEFPPPQGKECPPCWLCCWYLGFLPQGRVRVKMALHDPGVRKAVLDTEARKVTIAKRIRAGTINRGDL